MAVFCLLFPFFLFVVSLEVADMPEVFIPTLGTVIGTRRETVFTKRVIYSYLGISYAKSPSGKRRFRGKPSQTYLTNRTVYNYLGINYAKSPSGALRFQPPQKFPPWQGIYMANRMRQRCPQMDMAYYPSLPEADIDRKDDEEDCLVVNVFTPKMSQQKLLPVLFYVHGGSFYAGSAYDFLPDFLLEKDIVLVVVQYRLGPLGFLSLQTDSIPGNAGMLDIIMALEWVQENIKWFWGDASKVTIMGQSAGGAAVSALLVSPLTKDKGLFSQLLIHSGSVVAPWALSKDPVPATKKIAELAQCNSKDDQEIADCLRKVPYETLIEAHMKFIYSSPTSDVLQSCNLVIQKAGGDWKFLDKDPHLQITQGDFIKVPTMGGSTRDEGTAFAITIYGRAMNETEKYFQRNITRETFDTFGDKKKHDYDIDFYQNEFFNGVKNMQAASPSLIDLSGLMLIKGPTTQIVRQMSHYKPTYLYSFDFLGNVSKLRNSEPDWDTLYSFPVGVTHSDELGYLFPQANHQYTPREYSMVKTMVNLWTNFIIKGSPTPAPGLQLWPTMSNEFGPYFKIDDTSVVQDNIYDEYRINQKQGYAKSSANKTTKTIIASICSIIALLRH